MNLRMLAILYQALKEELSSVERRAEEERAAHNATKMVFIYTSLSVFFCNFVVSLLIVYSLLL